MSYPQQPHPQDPWGRQTQGAPQGQGRPGYGQPPSGPAAPWPGHGPRDTVQRPGRPAHGPQPRQGGPPSGLPNPPQSPYGSRPPYGQDPYGKGDPYGPPQLQYDYDYELGSPPPKRNSTLIIGLSVGLGVLLLGGGAVGAVSYLNSSGSETTTALPNTSSPPTAAPWESSPPSGDLGGEPSGMPSWDPFDDPTTEPTGPAADPTPDPTIGPTGGPSGQAAPGSPIAETEFDDWRLELPSATYSANKVAGWTYETCDPVDGEGVLAKNKCERAIQVAYTSYRGHLKAVQVTMAFPTEKAAEAAVAKLAKRTSNAVSTRRDMTFTTYAYGKIRANAIKRYVIATIVTADNTAKSKANKFHLYLQADAVRYFLLRDVTVTS